jgi:hypothetical protein
MPMPVGRVGTADTERDGPSRRHIAKRPEHIMPEKGLALFLLGTMLPEQ